MAVAITLQFPSSGPLGNVGFAYSPALEATLSLRVVLDPKRYPMHLPWARRTRDLSPELRREIEALSFVYRDVIPGIFEVGLSGDFATFEDELHGIATCDHDQVVYELTCSFGGWACGDPAEDPDVVHDPEFQRQVLANAGQADPSAVAILEEAFTDPAPVRERIAAMLERYWKEAFHEEWDRIRPRLESEVGDMARTLMGAGMDGFVEHFLPEWSWNPDLSALQLERPYERDVDVAARDGLAFVPVVYDFRVTVEADAPWNLSVFLPLRSMRQPEVPQASDHEVATGLRALGDETRLQILRLLGDAPRSTKELATLLSLSESAVSRHLKTLASAEVVDSERDGYYVLYQLKPDRIGAIGGALRRTLGMAPTLSGTGPARPVVAPRADQLGQGA